MAEPTGTEIPTEDAGASAEGVDADAQGGVYDDAGNVTEYGDYSTQTPAEAAAVVARPVLTGHGGATGRRKEAIARVRVMPGSGQWKINGRALSEYFPNKVHQQLINEPFVTLSAENQFDVIARISGGGVTGQAGALRLGIARALTEIDPENRPALKKAGFLTRDARVKERKKYGLKKARKAPQYSKR